jgi:molybdopterin biosynthesis enzyme MoaB
MVQRVLDALVITLKTRDTDAYSKKRIQALVEYAEAEGFEVTVERKVAAK